MYLNVINHPLSATARAEEAFGRFDVSDGTQQAILTAIENEANDDAAMMAVVASASGVVVSASFPEPPLLDLIEQENLPRLAPFIEADQSLTHHLIASIAEDGLSLIAYPRHGEPVIENLRGGDLEAAAILISRVAESTDCSLVILCGLPTSLDIVQPLVERSVPITCPVTRVEVGAVADHDSLADDIVRIVSDRSARRIVEMLRLFRYHASHGEAIDGVVETTSALREGRAGVVLLHADPEDDRQGWFGPAFDRISSDFSAAAPIDPSEPLLNARLVDVVLRSAIGQGVPVFIVPTLPDDRLADGIGAITKRDHRVEAGLQMLVEQ